MTAATIRLATDHDLAVLAPLFDAYRQFYGLATDPALAREYLAARLARAESLVLLAVDARGAAAGFCQLYPTWDSLLAAPMGVLYDLYVAPPARRSGVARALLLAAAALAREHGLARLELSTAIDNQPAQALYESLGWVLGTRFLTYSLRP